jgi:hypothetical protein
MFGFIAHLNGKMLKTLIYKIGTQRSIPIVLKIINNFKLGKGLHLE